MLTPDKIVQLNDTPWTKDIRARVPDWMKSGLAAEAQSRLLGEPDIIREALLEYLEVHQPKSVPMEVKVL